MRVKDIYSSAALCLLGLLSIFWIIPSYCPEGDGFGVPPSTLPYTLCGVIVALSVITFVKVMMTKAAEASEDAPRTNLKHTGFIALMLVLAVPAFKFIGFIPTGVLFLFGFQWLLGQRNWLPLIILAAGLPTVLYVLLWHVLRVTLP